MEALDLLELEYSEVSVVTKSIRFKNILELKNISFNYNNKTTIFKNLNISIKGSSIGIKGKQVQEKVPY